MSVSFLTMGVRDSYVWGLDFLRLRVSDSYVWGLVIPTFEGYFFYDGG